jgi:hypothetical protein
MTTKADFSQEEWDRLLEAPLAVSLLVSTSDPNVFDAVKESLASARAIAVAAKSTTASELLHAVTADLQHRETAKEARPELSSKDPVAVRRDLLAHIGEASSALQQKASPEEADEIRRWLYQVGVDVAEAAKEGGVFGIGGTRVSDAEKQALADLAQALGITPPS